MATTNGKPTSRQLSYLKKPGQPDRSDIYLPPDQPPACAEINRLKQTKPSSRTERYVERKLIADQIATGPLDAARVRDEEIHGRGSSATWMHNREQDPPPVEDPGPHVPRRRRAPVVGKRTELARYTVAEGERIPYGQRIDGIVRFLPGNVVVLVGPLGPTENSTCRCRRTVRTEGCTKPHGRKRPNGAREPRCLVARQREGGS
jgi:hypothetical protein